MSIVIAKYSDGAHRAGVVALWRKTFDYGTPHNDPDYSLDMKLKADDGLLFVALQDGAVIGTTMAGFDGHRGWIYSVAVDPSARRRGVGAALVQHAEQALAAIGCPKINLQIVSSNEEVVGFYKALGFSVEPRISMGKRLPWRG
ncbi:GNAT family acetyltransferase [Variovorax sp. Sphag1AA]|uniref:GNAT family acetyltransferase n=1 Tax=Variovorax sp. Sphag1AA TaxID=2587027 RepID=UPI001618D4E5|nr:GNAT family acetyltransferase [Variovorax sp. Sphag1AA]MBB3175811.1 ribosomal protein S18 acetylase RimI-like enzyme [Variovorax sp. Sphag1AA]